jgi:hypothetical protein
MRISGRNRMQKVATYLIIRHNPNNFPVKALKIWVTTDGPRCNAYNRVGVHSEYLKSKYTSGLQIKVAASVSRTHTTVTAPDPISVSPPNTSWFSFLVYRKRLYIQTLFLTNRNTKPYTLKSWHQKYRIHKTELSERKKRASPQTGAIAIADWKPEPWSITTRVAFSGTWFRLGLFNDAFQCASCVDSQGTTGQWIAGKQDLFESTVPTIIVLDLTDVNHILKR